MNGRAWERHDRGHAASCRLRRSPAVWAVVLASAVVAAPTSTTARYVAPVRTVNTQVVAELGAGAAAVRLVAGTDDLYVIAAPGRVRRYILHGLPRAELFTQVMRWKEGADGLIMGRPLDLSLTGDRLLILDDLASLWGYQGATYTRSLIALRVSSAQGQLDAVATHGGDLLALDPARRMIWRYRATSGGYDTLPQSMTVRPVGPLALASRVATSADGLLALAHDTILLWPWKRPAAWRMWRPGAGMSGIWAAESHHHFLVSFARTVAICASTGQIEQVLTLRGLRGETVRDVALDSSRRLYVLTATRILRVTVTLAPL